MTLLLNTTIKISLIVLIALATTFVLRKRSAAVRHFVLAVALACAAATPFVRLIAPAWQSSAAWLTPSRMQLIDRPLAVLTDDAPAASSGAPQAAASRWNMAAVARGLGILWLGGVGVELFVLSVGISRLSWLAFRAGRATHGAWPTLADEIAQIYGLRRPIALLHSDHPSLLVTWGVFHPKVLLPADALTWPDDRIRIVLAHELAHIRRSDWVVQMAAELLKAVYWFNPLVWIARRRLRLESEQACDDAVLKMGVEGSTYATELVDLAKAFRLQRQMFLPAAAIARPSSLERRVRAMLNVRLNRDPITRSASIAAGIGLVAVTVLVAGFGASAQTFSTVFGSLVDPLGRVLPGVTLVLSNAQNQSKYEIKSDATGHYEFVGLPAGNYTLVAEYPGFAGVKREGIALAGQAFESNAVMQVGSVQETITVTDAPWYRELRETADLLVRLDRGPGSQPRSQAAKQCNDSPVGGNIRPPTKTKDVRPIYPVGAGSAQVHLEGRIGIDGLMTGVQVVGDADPALANAAIDAVNAWEFTPTFLDCQPIEVRMKVEVNFVSAK
jgi:beta-lactamase regulating signal transducer with metallopeptidase domain